MTTTYEVCATCRCALANADVTGMSDRQHARFEDFTSDKGHFICTDEHGLGDSCDACGYSDYEATFYVVNEQHA